MKKLLFKKLTNPIGLVLALAFPALVMGQVTYNGNGNTGFGGTLGSGDITINDGGTTINFTFNAGASFNDELVIYIDSEAGGFTNTSTFNDGGSGDLLRNSISGFDGSNRTTVNFPSGFEADFAIALNTGFAGLWELSATGAHTFITNANIANPSGNTYTFDVDFADLNTTDIQEAFRLVATYLNGSNVFRSNEAIGDGITGGNPGSNGNITFNTYFEYSSGDEGGLATTTSAGNWSASSTWTNGNVPLAGDEVEIDHNVTVDQDITVTSITISTGNTLTASDASPRTITVSRSESGSAATITNNGTWANGTGGSTVIFSGNPNSGDAIHQTSGTIAFDEVRLEKESGATDNVGVDFQTNSSVSGRLTIGSGGFVSTSPPTGFYGSNAILVFDQGSGANFIVGSTGNTWSTVEVPNNITINSGTVTLQGDRTATGALDIANGATLVIDPLFHLNFGGNLTNNGTLDIKSDASGYGQIVVDGTRSGTGTTIHESYIDDGQRWYNIAYPVSTSSFGDISGITINNTGNSSTHNIYHYDAANVSNGEGTWIMTTSGSLSPGTGYSIFLDNGSNFGTLPATVTATGSLTAGDQTISITPEAASNPGTGSNAEGWNYIGNPFAAALDWDAISANNSDINSTYWIFDGDGTGSGGQWFAYNSAAGTPAGATDAGQYIAPGQAFFINSDANSANSISIRTSDVALAQNNEVLYKNGQQSPESLTLTIKDLHKTTTDYTYIGFKANMSDAKDKPIDSEKRFNDFAEIPAIYTKGGGDNMIYNFIDNQFTSRTIDLYFEYGNGKNALEIQGHFDYLDPSWSVHLEDKLRNTFTDLRENNYQFSHNTNNKAQRFTLHINKGYVSTESFDLSEVFAYRSGENYKVNLEQLTGSQEITLYDVQGRVVLAQSAQGGSVIQLLTEKLKSGVYILKVEQQGQTLHTQKIIK